MWSTSTANSALPSGLDAEQHGRAGPAGDQLQRQAHELRAVGGAGHEDPFARDRERATGRVVRRSCTQLASLRRAPARSSRDPLNVFGSAIRSLSQMAAGAHVKISRGCGPSGR